MAERPAGYMPAIGFDFLLPFYDPLCWLLRADRFKRRLVDESQIGRAQRVLDLGCGTATLTLMIQRAHPDAEVVGLDGDPKVLAIARRKVARAGAAIALDEGMAYALPYPDASFDRVLSSLVLHHLSHDDKLRTLREARRVLRPGGELHVADFGAEHAHGHGGHGHRGLLARLVHRHDILKDNLEGKLPQLMLEAGLVDAAETGQHATILGSISFFRARR